MKKKIFIILGMTILLLSSCSRTIDKYLQIVDGSKSDGTLTMIYEYPLHWRWIKYNIRWDDAKVSAIKKCQSWGYSSAEFFDAGLTQCISFDMYGNCIMWRVTYKCQCTK